MTLSWLAYVVAFAGQFLTALVFFPVLACERRRRVAVLLGLGLLIALFPLLVPAGARLPRFFAAVGAISFCAKLYDLHVGAEKGSRPGWRTFLTLLPNIFSLVARKLDAIPRPTLRENLLRLALRLAQAAGLALFAHWVAYFDWRGIPWPVQHGAVTLGFFFVGVAGVGVPAALWRLGGGRGFDFVNANALLAPTPAEFWRRWNLPTQQFFYEDVFKPAGGLRHPFRAIAVIFLLSVAMHEYVFGIALSRVQGYQTVFFLFQGLAVAATVHIRPTGWKVWPATALTLAFNLACSVFFMASVCGLYEIYTGAVPAWMRGG